MEIASLGKSANVYEILFKSAKHGTRKPLINRNTANERDNPKTLEEGEVEKVHLVLKYTKNETTVFLEKNRDELSMQNIIDYFNYFQRKLNHERGYNRDYHFKEEK